MNLGDRVTDIRHGIEVLEAALENVAYLNHDRAAELAGAMHGLASQLVSRVHELYDFIDEQDLLNFNTARKKKGGAK